jgi:hypothetical protein
VKFDQLYILNPMNSLEKPVPQVKEQAIDQKFDTDPIQKPVEERVFTIDEKIGLYNNGIVNDSSRIAAQAVREQEENEKISTLRSELGLPPENAGTLSVSKDGKLEEGIQEPETSVEKLEEERLENKLDTLEEELAALSPEEKKAILGGEILKGKEQYWEFKKSGKKGVTFLQLMLNLMDGKAMNLKKLALVGDYITGMKEEVKAELVYEKDHFYEKVKVDE